MQKRDLVSKMGILEIVNQAKFTEIAFENILKKSSGNNAATFSSIHSFLTHSAVISRLLWSPALAKNVLNKTLADILNLQDNLKLKERKFRDVLDHYDEYLKKWIDEKNGNAGILDNNIGPKDKLKVSNAVWIRHYDPTTTVFTLIDKDLDLNEIHQEIKKVKAAAEKWLNPSLSWDELDDEEKQAVDEDRLVEEISDDYSSGDTEEAIERLEDLGLDIGDLNL